MKLKGEDTEIAIDRLIKRAQASRGLSKSLTWDRGKEMVDDQRFTLATDIQVHFNEPQHPWQRGFEREHQRTATPILAQGTDFSASPRRNSMPWQGA